MRYLSCVLGYKVGAWKGKKQKRNASCCQELGLELGRRKGARACLGLDGCRVSRDLRPWGCCWQTASEKAGGGLESGTVKDMRVLGAPGPVWIRVRSGHPAPPWMTELQLLRFDFQMHPLC